MKKNYFYFIVFIFVLFVSFNNASAWTLKSRTTKANEFIKAKMIPQAIKILEEEINENPMNSEAHFQLGLCYFHNNNQSANERFESAFGLDSKYGYKIAQSYLSAGDIYLSRGMSSKSITKYQKAIFYNKTLKNSIVKKCFNKMVFWFNRASLNINMSNTCSRSADDLARFILENNRNFKDKIKTEQVTYAQNCLQTAKSKTRNQQKLYIKEANKYLTQQQIYAVIPPPNWKIVFEKEYVGIGFTGGKSKYSRNPF